MNHSIHIQASLNELGSVVEYLNSILPSNALLFLSGDLASGKTTLTSALAKAHGVEGGATSPTFSLQQTYGDDIFHYDLYRIDNADFFAMGLHEEFERVGWHIIEWADEKLKEFMIDAGYHCYFVTITPTATGRDYFIEY